MEAEAVSRLRESVSTDGAELLHLREADRPKLRRQLAQLEAGCSRMTSDLCRLQQRLQQVQLLLFFYKIDCFNQLEQQTFACFYNKSCSDLNCNGSVVKVLFVLRNN